MELHRLIVKKTGIPNPLVIKRNFSHANPIEKITLEKHGEKKLIDLRFFNNITIYAEDNSNETITKW